MKNVLLAFGSHKDLYSLAIAIGGFFSTIGTFFVENTPDYLFGINASLWGIALLINLIDIHTGIKADTKRKFDLGLKFKFESGKGWRAFEKIFVFTMIIWFIYTLELEAIRVQTISLIPSVLLYVKFTLLIYVVLIEIQSIGENEITRFGKKGSMFIMLDRIISIVNEGVFKKLKSLLEV
jgi:hypothetical protein